MFDDLEILPFCGGGEISTAFIKCIIFYSTIYLKKNDNIYPTVLQKEFTQNNLPFFPKNFIIVEKSTIPEEPQMLNIEFKGTLKGDIEQISLGTPLPEGSVVFKEPDTFDKAFLQGSIFAGPLVMIMMLGGYIRIFLAFGRPHGLKFGSLMLAFFISFAFIFVS